MGQNPGYINSIENGKSFPTMMNFFYICEFLHLSPSEFFDMSSDDPEKLRLLMESIKKLSDRQVDSLMVIVDGMLNKYIAGGFMEADHQLRLIYLYEILLRHSDADHPVSTKELPQCLLRLLFVWAMLSNG